MKSAKKARARQPHPSTAIRKAAMIKALEKTMGIVTTAAGQVGINPKTHYEWMNEDKDYNATVEALTDMALDFAESKLHTLINGATVPDDKVFMVKEGRTYVHKVVRGEKKLPPDTAATIFFLKTKGKKRGYIERQEFDHTTGGDKIIFPTVTFAEDKDK